MNLEDIARRAGVSRSTVSRVVNGDARVSDEVRRRVQAVIQEHGYHPNAAARSLASRRTRIFGLLIPRAVGSVFSDPFFPRLIEGAVGACNEADHNLMLLMDTTEDQRNIERLYQRVIRGRHLDGIVIASSVVDDPVVARLCEDDFPFVLVGRHPHHPEISFVDVNNREAARQAVAHLLQHGRRRIAKICGPANVIPAIDRYGGYVSALLDAGLMPDQNLVRHSDFTSSGGYRAMRSLLPHHPDAVFCANDPMAFGALRALHEAGLRTPEDVAVIGFDGLEEGESTTPPLSTVFQDTRALGREAVRTLLDITERSRDGGGIRRLLTARLLLRRSCGCAQQPEKSPGGISSRDSP
ncbi:LacI family DNA-binding transcriptional regulator [Rubrobacter calidifluminis]|uniref:LacI family DNA-binding transcriptional regulator n=1 Tax=Rubrobacter calidifluminis TaxID=1392640 RepID=UPI0023601418|nr:LacI family DNA-binding transcriptional regulator [Rubrobacter calidifluminis]